MGLWSSAPGNPIVISGPTSGYILDGKGSIKVHHIDIFAGTSGTTLTVRKESAAGSLYGHVRGVESGATISRTLDGMWFRNPYVSEFTSGVAYIYLMDKQ